MNDESDAAREGVEAEPAPEVVHAPGCEGTATESPCACGLPTPRGERLLLRLKQGVHATVLVGQATVVSFRTGNYYVVKGMGSRLFLPLIGGALREEDFVLQAASYANSPSAEKVRPLVRELVEYLVAEDIIERFVTTDAPAPPVSSYTAWEKFVGVERYDDMADILTQDPIHEVGPHGWPERA